MSFSCNFTGRQALTASALALAAVVAVSSPARAQDMASKESAAAVKAAFLADLENLRSKFVGLAQAFPAEKYTWRPMDGVRSVSEVFMLIATEGQTMIPAGFGGKAADIGGREGMARLAAITDKAQVLDNLNKGLAYARKELESVDPAQLSAKHQVMGAERTTLEGAVAILGDLHEHLGQMIAYARTNHIVPPWSK